MTILQYALSYADGEVYGFADCDTMPVLADGCVAHVMVERVQGFPPLATPTTKLYVSNGELAHVETATLDDAKVHAWALVKQARDAAEKTPFEFEGGMYDPDKENISGAALAALLAQLAGQEVADEWTLADNSRRTLTGQQIIDLGLALTQKVKNIHERGRILRDRINNSMTPAEAYGHTWESLDEQ